MPAWERRAAADAETTPLRDPAAYQYDLDLPDIAEVWRRGSVIASWLLDLTAAALAADPALDHFQGRVSDSGEGRWTLEAAIDEAVPANVLAAALFGRFTSRGEADFQNRLLSAMRAEFGGHAEKDAASEPGSGRSRELRPGPDPGRGRACSALSPEAFSYFVYETNPANGLVVDRTEGHAPASIAAVGLGLTAYPVAVERGFISRREAAERTLTTLRFFWGSKQGPEPDATGYRGFYYHFLDMRTGARVACELSTVDSALLLAGMLTAAAYFDEDRPTKRGDPRASPIGCTRGSIGSGRRTAIDCQRTLAHRRTAGR